MHLIEPADDIAGRRSYLLLGHRITAPPARPGLHVVATPIGNLSDIAPRALATLAGVDAIACEDTRVSRKLLERFGISVPLISYHEHNADAVRPKLIARLQAGEALALISDAGTPLVSDPGFKLVREARERDLPVTTVPGPSAVLAALTLAGIPCDRFFFEGFLPARQGARRTRIGELAAIPATLVLFESGPRLGECLADLAATFGPRMAAVCRELTKMFEEVRRAPLDALARAYADEAPKGEIVIVIEPPGAEATTADDIDTLLRKALATASVKDAAASVAAATGLPKRQIYARAIELSGGGDA